MFPVPVTGTFHSSQMFLTETVFVIIVVPVSISGAEVFTSGGTVAILHRISQAFAG